MTSPAASTPPRRSGARLLHSARSAAKGPAGVDTPRGLVWVSDQVPGIRRVRVGDDFAYVGPDGKRVRNASELQRIRALAIPPAYEDVWICVRANGHIQATGRDARGRKQYRYHPEWRLAKDADKFERMLEFGAALPRIRKRVAADLAAPVGTRPRRETVLATIVRLLDTTYVRIGNEEYARENKSFGLTTLRNRHAAVSGDRLRLRFRGKSGKEHEVALDDPRVAKVVRRCQNMPGQELFQYVDEDGEVRSVGSAEVNDYIREISGADFTAKDFRTWHGTAHALALWLEHGAAEGKPRPSVKELLGEVAKRLGNTIAVCKKSYVHPRVLEALASELDAELLEELDKASRRAGLSAGERRLLAFLSRA
jgi:DNA topoisomerase-1